MQNENISYELKRYYEYVSKNKKAYIIVVVYMTDNEKTDELLKICCDKTDALIDYLHEKIEDEDFDVKDNVVFGFNNYKKVYEPRFTF